MRQLLPEINRGLIREIIIYIVVLAFVLVAKPLCRVEGHSMDATLDDQQLLIVNGLTYSAADRDRNDIVIFHAPDLPAEDPPLVKRLIGLPGDTVEFRNTILYVNGVEVDEPYLNEPCNPNLCRDNVWHLGPDEYFFMGDNRNHSRDSRRFGPVNNEYIIGQVLVRVWPPWEFAVLAD